MRLTNSNRCFSSSNLKLLIEDCRTNHAEQVNNNKNVVELVVGDIFMAMSSIQSDASSNRVAKLSYQIRGPFRIDKCTGS